MVAVFVAPNFVDGVCQRKPNQESLGGIVFKPVGHRVAGFVRQADGGCVNSTGLTLNQAAWLVNANCR